MIRYARARTWLAVFSTALCAAALLVGVSVTVAPSPSAQAANAADWNPGNIIDDATFYDANAMSASDIQAFLQQRLPRCSAGYTCLKDYRQPTASIAADRYCNGYVGAPDESAATIIDRVARSCGVSQKVLLVVLEKEQSLITDPSPSARQYNYALGQGCPDTAPCDSATAGLFRQLYYGARQYEIYRLNPASFGYQAGKWNNILYHPYNNCGTQRVYIENQATAGLYIYTPYVPNAAALANLYGTGDGCSSYGNRNFWRLFTDWFGTTSTQNSPFGGFNVEVDRGLITVLGWALDPNEPSTALTVTVTANGEQLGQFAADDNRPDVGAAYPGYGDRHGIRRSFEVVGGDTRVCVTVKNVGAGADTTFECQSVRVETASPYGGATVEALAGGLKITGWTLDTDTTEPLAVHVYIDGIGSAYTADASRPDVGAVFPGMGDNHGIDLALPAAIGTHEVCVYGINVGRGMNKLLGCSSITVSQSPDPVGQMEDIFPEPGGFRVRGWAVDPNTSDPLNVHIYRGSSGTAVQTTVRRDDILAQYPNASVTSGFDAHVDAPAGAAAVCAYGINVGWGVNTTLGCRSVQILSGNPFGGIDTAVTGSTIRVRGWAIDPDTTASIDVHFYIDGVGTAGRADIDRPDVGDVYPGYGPRHGIDASFEVAPGVHQVCAYGINRGPGGNALLGCRQVTAVDPSPFGGTSVTEDQTGIRLQGWTIDPDSTEALTIHVYVDGIGTAIARADVLRPDVARAYPSAGGAHGIDLRFALAKGSHTVCTYAINVGPGANRLLGCQSVVVG